MTRPAPNCFSEDNSRAEAMSGNQIYTAMTTGPGTSSLQTAANTAKALERTYAELEGRLKRIGETLGEAWGGASADAAIAAANPINQAMVQMQDSLRQADRSFSNQVYQFNHDKARLKNVPQNKPDTDLWDDVTPWDTDAEDAVNKFNGDEAHNRQVYREYQSASRTNRGELPQEMAGITADNLNVEVVDPGSNNQSNTTNTAGSGRPTGTGSPNFPTSTGSPQGPTGTTFTPPPGINGGDTTTSWAGGGDGGGGGGNKPGDLGGGGNKPPIGSVIERPVTAGIPPIGVPGGPGLGGGAGRGPGGGGGAGKVGGGAGAGKFGGGLSGTGAGQQSAGKAGVFGGMGENTAAGRGGAAAGATGKAGAAGMGGMAGAGAKGQGDEDKEHKSADYLVTEENTNEIIGDMPMVAPPTIGG